MGDSAKFTRDGAGLYVSIDDMRPASLQDLPSTVSVRRSQNMKLRGNVGIIRVSNTIQTDSAKLAIKLFEQSTFRVTSVIFTTNLNFENALTTMLTNPTVHIIVCIGGTGISKTDTTIEIVKGKLEKELDGFGELFRHLTHTKWKHLAHDIGILSLDTRTTAGVANNKLIFAIPGSPDATVIAIKELIIPGVPALLGQLLKDKE